MKTVKDSTVVIEKEDIKFIHLIIIIPLKSVNGHQRQVRFRGSIEKETQKYLIRYFEYIKFKKELNGAKDDTFSF